MYSRRHHELIESRKRDLEEKERSDEASRLARFIQMHDLQQVRAVRKRMMVERERETASKGI